MKNHKKLFAENLKVLMNEKGVNQARLARALGVDQTTISAWLREKYEPSLSKICLMAEYFDCALDEFVE